jgi:hypothetical protein
MLCAVVCFSSGCTTQFRTGDFTLLSTKNVNLDSGKLVHRERVVNEEKSQNNDPLYIKDAIDHAIDQDPCAVALSDVAVYLIRGFASFSIKVEGNKVIDLNRKGCENK